MLAETEGFAIGLDPLEAQKIMKKAVTSLPDGPEAVNHPAHYTSHPSGIECIAVTKHMNFPLGNAVKYIWRADLKGSAIEDLEKAKRYLEIEIERLMEAA
ncbi:DUF3310 domain-containing protein [Streptomyces syringium]|uniref:DUF3310 domain-containing protein n=1 Tax=Streptomyces syringium TaxID=76729 RepID=UPI003D8CBBB9